VWLANGSGTIECFFIVTEESARHRCFLTHLSCFPAQGPGRVWLANGSGTIEALDVSARSTGHGLRGPGGSIRSLCAHAGGEPGGVKRARTCTRACTRARTHRPHDRVRMSADANAHAPILTRHSTFPTHVPHAGAPALLASAGLDRFVRVHDTSSRRSLLKLYMKQQLTGVVFAPVPDSVAEAAAAVAEGDAAGDAAGGAMAAAGVAEVRGDEEEDEEDEDDEDEAEAADEGGSKKKRGAAGGGKARKAGGGGGATGGPSNKRAKKAVA
jgi:hypothetical protein